MALVHFQTQMQSIADSEQNSNNINEKNRLRIEFRDKMYKVWKNYNSDRNNAYCSLDRFGKCITDILENCCIPENEHIYKVIHNA